MENILSIQISKEHIDRNSAATPKEAIKELIWNACDADAKGVRKYVFRRNRISSITWAARY